MRTGVLYNTTQFSCVQYIVNVYLTIFISSSATKMLFLVTCFVPRFVLKDNVSMLDAWLLSPLMYRKFTMVFLAPLLSILCLTT